MTGSVIAFVFGALLVTFNASPALFRRFIESTLKDQDAALRGFPNLLHISEATHVWVGRSFMVLCGVILLAFGGVGIALSLSTW